MKHERFCAWILSAGLSALLAFGSLACMVTGLGLSADLRILGLFCLIYALAASAALHGLRRGGLLAAVGTALALGCQLCWGDLGPSFWRMAVQVSYLYHLGYGWPYLGNPYAAAAGTCLPAVCALAAGVTLLLLAVFQRRKGLTLGLLVSLLPLGSSLLLTDTVPETWCLILTFGAVALPVLTDAVRRRSSAEGVKLTAMLLIPVYLAVLLLFWAVPAETYQLPEDIFSRLLGRAPSGGETAVDGWESVLNLKTVGVQSYSERRVMEVNATAGGTLYLRGQAYENYTGQSWDTARRTDSGWPVDTFDTGAWVTVRTDSALSILYTPYYIRDYAADPPVNGRIANGADSTAYSFQIVVPLDGQPDEVLLTQEQMDACLALPADTQAWAQGYLEEHGIDILTSEDWSSAGYDGTVALAERIGNLVRTSATYDLRTSIMPSGYTDFAQWFLEQSDTGYCVHFATAAAVLLRAAGIPCRYVTGYLVDTEPGTDTEVQARHGHAWVEYYAPAYGWKILEVTPGNDAQVLPTLPAEPTETSPPPETTAPTDPPESSSPPEPTPSTQETEPRRDTADPAAPDVPLWFLPAAVCALAALAWVESALRRGLRRRSFRRGSPNRRALARWRYLCRLSRILRCPTPEEAERLAEKARFSQHRITRDELALLDGAIAAAAAQIGERPWPMRVLLRLILATD